MQTELLTKILTGDLEQPEINQLLLKHIDRVSQLSTEQLREIYTGNSRSRYARLIYYMNHTEFSVNFNSVLHASLMYYERNANIMAHLINQPAFRSQDEVKALEMLHFIRTLEDDVSVVYAASMLIDDTVLKQQDALSFVEKAVKEEQKNRKRTGVNSLNREKVYRK